MTNKTLQSNKVDLLSTQLIDFNQRRITNAANAVNQQDYVTLAQLNTAIAGIATQVAAIQQQPTIIGAASVRMTTTGTITIAGAGNARSPITFDTKDTDTGGFWNSGSNTKLTISKNGVYLIFYNAPTNAIAQSNFQLNIQNSTSTIGINPLFFQIRKNGNNTLAYAGMYAEGFYWQNSPSTFIDLGNHANGSAVLTLIAGDYVELVVWCNFTGGSLNNITYPPSVVASQQPLFGIVGPLPS